MFSGTLFVHNHGLVLAFQVRTQVYALFEVLNPELIRMVSYVQQQQQQHQK